MLEWLLNTVQKKYLGYNRNSPFCFSSCIPTSATWTFLNTPHTAAPKTMQGRNFLYLRFQYNQDPANLLQQKGARALPLYKAAKTEGSLLLFLMWYMGEAYPKKEGSFKGPRWEFSSLVIAPFKDQDMGLCMAVSGS